MIKIVKTISFAFEKARRRIKVLVRGKSDVQTDNEGMPFGVDSIPPVGWRAIHLETGEKGKTIVIGYINELQLEGLVSGEFRIYSLDPDGVLSTSIFLRGDGTMEVGGDVDFMVRFNALKTAFDELKSDVNSHISNWNSFAGAYVPGSPTVTGLPPTATSSGSSSADIDPAKIAEIKTQ